MQKLSCISVNPLRGVALQRRSNSYSDAIAWEKHTDWVDLWHITLGPGVNRWRDSEKAVRHAYGSTPNDDRMAWLHQRRLLERRV